MPVLKIAETAPAVRFSLISLILLLAACGPKTLPPASPLDTSANHFKRGMAKFERGELQGAQAEFERAHALDPDHPGSYAGYGLVSMAQGDFWSARQQIEQSLHKDDDVAITYTALGRIVTEEGIQRGYSKDDWLDEAVRAYRKPAALAPADPGVHYWQGQSYLKARELESARLELTRVIEQNTGPYVALAMAEVERIQTIQRASPGSELGLKIAMVERITRAELTVLLLEELKLAELVKQRRPTEKKPFRTPHEEAEESAPPEDVSLLWARPWIEEILSLGVPGLEVMPDNTFRPEKPLTRASYARVNQGILGLITTDQSLSTRYVGEESRFPDVRGDSYAYNAIAVSVERGIMSADRITGRFRPDESVSGAEALLMIRELQNAVRMEF